MSSAGLRSCPQQDALRAEVRPSLSTGGSKAAAGMWSCWAGEKWPNVSVIWKGGERISASALSRKLLRQLS
jgi:hypothetical protein